MVGYQLDLATIGKMIHKAKGSIFLNWNLWNFDWGPISFSWRILDLLIHDQRIKGLVILWLGPFKSCFGGVVHCDWGPLSFDHKLFIFYYLSLGSYLQVENPNVFKPGSQTQNAPRAKWGLIK